MTLTDLTVLAYLAAPGVVTLAVMAYAIAVAVHEHFSPSAPVRDSIDD